MQATSIAWTDFSANPLKYRDKTTGKTVWACVKTSPGCAHCYSEALTRRYNRGKLFTAANMREVEPYLCEDELHKMLTARRVGGKDVAGSRCFVGDMTDVFGEWVSDELLDRLFAVFALRSDVTWQVLTKRAKRMQLYCTAMVNGKRKIGDGVDGRGADLADRLQIAAAFGVKPINGSGGKPPYMPFANVWLGVSIEDQQRADERIPHLVKTPAAVRFLSCEPLLGTINLTRLPVPGAREGLCYNALNATDEKRYYEAPSSIAWVIVGGESGHGARPCDVSWIRSIVRQCQESGTACFVKQLGSKPFSNADKIGHRGADYKALCPERKTTPVFWRFLNHSKGEDPAEWPEDLRVRQFPEVSHASV